MGTKSATFATKLSVQDCQVRFRSGVTQGRGASAVLGGLTAKLMGGESLSWAGPDDITSFLRSNPELADMHGDPPTVGLGVGVPKAAGAHANGTSVMALIWDRGDHREVKLWAFHSMTGGAHAAKLMDAAGAAMGQEMSPENVEPGAQVSEEYGNPNRRREGSHTAAPQTGPTDFVAAPKRQRGWHPDPLARSQVRWWDGHQWTENVGNNGVLSKDPIR